MPNSLPRRPEFPTTRISLIMAASGAPDATAREALSSLCLLYRYPIYAYVRRLGYAREDAEDLTQGFFARVMEKHYLRQFQGERGRFRSFLLSALKHFLANERDWAQAQKRGGSLVSVPLDDVLRTGESRYSLEPRSALTPEGIFERHWALAMLAHVTERMEKEAVADGKGRQFDRLKGHLTGDTDDVRYRELAIEMNTTEGALKVAVHRLRHRFRELLREEIAHTVTDPRDVGDELRYLIAALRT